MPSALSSQPMPPRHDDLDNYDAGEFSDDDPFGSPTPEQSSTKRKAPESGLGIDEEVSVQKRARVPNVKLDEDRLLGPAGIPRLRTRARDLKLKGKGHEFSDAARLLSFYQLWLDDLFPKAKFLDALGMVEKAGHKKKLMVARNGWIDEGKSRGDAAEDEDEIAEPDAHQDPRSSRQDGHDDVSAPRGPATPTGASDIPDDDDDLYDATPRAPRTTAPAAHGASDEDDLDALIAAAESHDDPPPRARPGPAAEDPDIDDLDALMAEAEGHDGDHQRPPGVSAAGAQEAEGNDFADEEAAMQEMEGLW